MRLNITILFLLLLASQTVSAFPGPVLLTDSSHFHSVSEHVELLEDKTGSIPFAAILHSADFHPNKEKVPNLPIGKSRFWLRFGINNRTSSDVLQLELAYPTIDSILLVQIDEKGRMRTFASGEYVPAYKRNFGNQNYIFEINIPAGKTYTYYMKVSASEQLQLPISIGLTKDIAKRLAINDLIFGLYAGLIFVMFLYNLFVFFTVRDRSYLFYVVYIFFVGFTQACVQGYASRFLYPDAPRLANLMLVAAPTFLGLAALGFLDEFMMMRRFTPRMRKGLFIFVAVYIAVMLLGLAGEYQICASVVQLNAGLASIYVIVVAAVIARKYRPARFVLIAWSIFLVSVIIFVLRNFNILPYNNFTFYALQIGSSLEVVLLSFALADKINIFRQEKEASQADALAIMKENEQIILNQKDELELAVTERTSELKASNEQLNSTLGELKSAQSQLVESEKMASLGQLTAGIAHEINNPINFVIANVNPLKRDILLLKDTLSQIETLALANSVNPEVAERIEAIKEEVEYEYLNEEIEFLLKGISEGSERTAEIVKGLKIFARVDEDDLKKVNIHDGIDSTTIIVNTLLNNRVVIAKQYGDLPLVECYPGKLNQVFLNVITNGIQAVIDKFKDQPGGKILIRTWHADNMAYISISDNGPGIPAEMLQRIFDPFFTTKQVGEGTGLGLSIAYNIIKKHNGKIIAESVPGEGTEFCIELPVRQPS